MTCDTRTGGRVRATSDHASAPTPISHRCPGGCRVRARRLLPRRARKGAPTRTAQGVRAHNSK
eukprot:11228541-Alexandrium_andersonii.AAC.1